MRLLPAIDLILFWGVIGTIGIAHALLLTSGTPWETTTWFYSVMWISSMIILMFCRILYQKKSQFDYDESLNVNKIVYVIGGVIAILFVSSFLVQAYTRSSIWVPQPHQTLSVGDMNLSAVVNDLFFTFALVANSEETLVLALTQVLRIKLSASSTSSYVPVLSIVAPRAGWAILHAYTSYVGPLMWILVLSAFVSGCIISWCAYNKSVKSFLVAVLIHALFNASIILASALNIL